MESTMTVNDWPSTKQGRNTPCFCGSGKKYKKCCLNSRTAETTNVVEEGLENGIKEEGNFKNTKKIFTYSKKSGKKMSQILLDYAGELLRESFSMEEIERTIFLAVAAWNISLIDEKNYSKEINHLLCNVMKISKNSREWKETHTIMRKFIEKKLSKYPDEDKNIVSYEFIDAGKKGFNLRVIYVHYDGKKTKKLF
jgi:SEC-C motif-containing protein